MARLHGVLVTYQRPDELQATLMALARQTRAIDHLVVVDNDPYRSAERVVSGAMYVATGGNLGPAGGLAVGVRVVLTDAAPDDWVVFLDDDDPPESDVELENLMCLASSIADDIGAVGKVGARYGYRTGRTLRVPDADLVGVVEVDWIGGGQLPVYRVAALAGVTMDPYLFFGFDDLDLGLRLRSGGWRLVVDGERWMHLRCEAGRHGLTKSGVRAHAGERPWRRYYSARNLVLIARRWGSWRSALYTTGDGLVRAVLAVRCGPAAGWMTLRGVVDGVVGRSGRRVEPG